VINTAGIEPTLERTSLYAHYSLRAALGLVIAAALGEQHAPMTGKAVVKPQINALLFIWFLG
jgi:hypothetical protein